MIVVGIDSGSICTGYGFVEAAGQKLSSIAFGTIRPKTGSSLPEKIEFIFERLSSLFDQYRPEEMSLEDIFMAKNAQSALKLGQVRGAIIVAGKLKGMKISQFSPTLVKSALTGYGRAEKSQVAFMVTKILGMREAPSSEDASDALALAITAILRKEVGV